MERRSSYVVRASKLEKIAASMEYSTGDLSRITGIPLNAFWVATKRGELPSTKRPFPSRFGSRASILGRDAIKWLKSSAFIFIQGREQDSSAAKPEGGVAGYGEMIKKMEDAVYKPLEIVDDMRKLQGGGSLAGRVQEAFGYR